MKRLFLVLLIFFYSLNAHAETYYMDGNQVHSALKQTDTSEYHLVTGYILGIADAFNNVKKGYEPLLFCIPANVSAGSLTDIVRSYLKAHPEVRHYEANAYVRKALNGAFPCYKN